VSAPYADVPQRSNAGVVYVFYGRGRDQESSTSPATTTTRIYEDVLIDRSHRLDRMIGMSIFGARYING